MRYENFQDNQRKETPTGFGGCLPKRMANFSNSVIKNQFTSINFNMFNIINRNHSHHYSQVRCNTQKNGVFLIGSLDNIIRINNLSFQLVKIRYTTAATQEGVITLLKDNYISHYINSVNHNEIVFNF